MIRAGKKYRRRQRPRAIVVVSKRRHGKVTYHLQETEMTISTASFKQIYHKL